MTKKTGKVTLQGMKYSCRIGCTAEERAFPQTISIDVELETDLEPVIRSGIVADGVCWAAADAILSEQSGSREWVLVEELADSVCDALFERFEAAVAILVRIRKFVFPHGDAVGVELRRERFL